MPSSIDSLRLGKANDGRRRLSDEERESIRRKHAGGQGVRSISREFPHVSRRLIQFVLFPARLKVLHDTVKREKRWGKYYHKDAWRETMRKHREKKKTLHAKRII